MNKFATSEGLAGSDTIGHMYIGQTGWVAPSALVLIRVDKCYLNVRNNFTGQPDSTHTMKVVKTYDGYIVVLPWGFKPGFCASFPWPDAIDDDFERVTEIWRSKDISSVMARS